MDSKEVLKERTAIRQIIDRGYGAFSNAKFILPGTIPGVIRSNHSVNPSETSEVEKIVIDRENITERTSS